MFLILAVLFLQYLSSYAQQPNACTAAAIAACNPYTCVQSGINAFCLCNDGSLQPTAASCGGPITTTQNPVVIPNVCGNIVCPANAQCIPTCLNPPRYICLCPNNIIGNPDCPTTQLANNPCQFSNPCLNGGTCAVNPLTLRAVCICPSGFYGPNCSYGCSRSCNSDWCYNGGRCTAAYGQPYCVCGQNYRGRRCELRYSAQNYVYLHRHPSPYW